MRYWARKDVTGKITTVESYSHDLDVAGAIEIDEMELNAFIASLPKPVIKPVRDLEKELDELKAKVEKLKEVK